MIKIIVPVLVIVALSACTSSPVIDTSAPAIRISDIVQGKMRKVGDEWVVYEDAREMFYEVNDQCIYNKKPIDCLRHGFVIEYDSGGEDVELSCVAQTNMKVNAGKIAEEKYVDTYQDDFYMPLIGSETRFVNVQYVSGESELSDLEISTTCMFNGEKVFDLYQRIRFP
jgi:hypothetical protein